LAEPENGKGQLETAGQYGDFTLQLDVLVNGKSLNSGVFFRCLPGEVMNGYESQIHNGFKTATGQAGRLRHGGIFRRASARKVVADDFHWFTKTIHAARTLPCGSTLPGDRLDDERKADPNPRNGLRVERGRSFFKDTMRPPISASAIADPGVAK